MTKTSEKMCNGNVKTCNAFVLFNTPDDGFNIIGVDIDVKFNNLS